MWLNILMYIKTFIFKLFKKKKNTTEFDQVKETISKDLELKKFVYDKSLSFTPEMYENIDWNSVPDPVIVNPGQDKVIMLVDDIEYTDLLYDTDFDNIKKEYKLDIKQKFTIVKCFGKDAGFIAYKYIVINKNKVDFAYIDITLGHKIKVFGSWFKEFDGIDLAIAMSEKHADIKFNFCTAHTLNTNNTTIADYDKKVKKYFNNKALEHFYLAKNSNRTALIYNQLKQLAAVGEQHDNDQQKNAV